MRRVCFFVVAVCCLAFNAKAYDFSDNSTGSTIYYNITLATAPMTVEVTHLSSNGNSYAGSVVIPSSLAYNGNTYFVTAIGTYAFVDCSGLTSVTIGDAVVMLGQSAFMYCTNLLTITCNAVNPPAIENHGFYSVLTDIFVHVPCDSEPLYKIANGWRNFTNYTDCIQGSSLNAVETANLSLYPNPTKDVLNIDCSDKVESVEIFNLLGQKVYSAKVDKNNTMIDVSNFAKGNYVAKLHTDTGITTKKFVVE